MFNSSTLVCPTCGSKIFNEKYAKDECFVCWNRPKGENGGVCNTVVGCYCSTCQELLPADRFGKHNDVYECKKCGKPQWGFTEYKKDRESLERDLNKYVSRLDSLFKFK